MANDGRTTPLTELSLQDIGTHLNLSRLVGYLMLRASGTAHQTFKKFASLSSIVERKTWPMSTLRPRVCAVSGRVKHHDRADLRLNRLFSDPLARAALPVRQTLMRS
jgi:hypothetical protein